jgi:MATE family multidrug resistance protein
VISLFFMVPLGLSTAAGVIVGSAYGARERAAMNRAALTGFGLAAAFGALTATLLACFAPVIAAAFTRDRDVQALATTGLRLAALFVIPDQLQVVAAQTLRSRGDVGVPAFTHFISYAVVMLPLSWTLGLGLHLGLPGILEATIVSSLMSAGLLLMRFTALARRPLG